MHAAAAMVVAARNSKRCPSICTICTNGRVHKTPAAVAVNEFIHFAARQPANKISRTPAIFVLLAPLLSNYDIRVNKFPAPTNECESEKDTPGVINYCARIKCSACLNSGRERRLPRTRPRELLKN
jgi:hypothetical protein